MLRTDSAIAQALPSMMLAVEGGDSADTKLPVHDVAVDVVEPGGWRVEPSDLTVEERGMWLCASEIPGTLER
jgi:hypothetical protein